MADPFLGQLMLVGFNFAPRGWFLAQGQILPISQYTALFSLLGTFYGGNGTSNFQLPNMQGNVPMGYGQGAGLSDYVIGETGGTSTVTLLATETPNHNHICMAKAAVPDASSPIGASMADNKTGNLYTSTATPLAAMSTSALPIFNGGSQPHENMMPYLGMYWIIAYTGVFPSRN